MSTYKKNVLITLYEEVMDEPCSDVTQLLYKVLQKHGAMLQGGGASSAEKPHKFSDS